MRNLVISYSTLLIIILIMGVNLYNLSIKNVGKEIRNQNKLILQNSVRNLDDKFRTMDALAGQVATNSNIVHLANKEDNADKDFYILALNAKQDLTVYLPTEKMLPTNSYFIYLQQPGYILSFSQFEDTSIYYSGKEKNKAELYMDWLTMMNNQHNYRKLIPMNTYKDSVSSSFLYILSLKNFSLRNIPANICFDINISQLEEIFNELSFFNRGYLYVTDNKDNESFSIIGEDSNKLGTETLRELEYEKGFATFHNGVEEVFVTQVDSDYNNWNYYFVQPANASLYSIEQYRNIFIVIILFAVALGFLLIVFLSRTNVKPIISLDNQLQDTIIQQETLQEVLETQRPIIQSSYLNKIILGEISSENELDYAIDYLDLDIAGKKFVVLYTHVYINQYEMNTEDDIVIGPDTDDFDGIINAAFNEYFDDPIYIFNPAENSYAILLSSPTDEDKEFSSLEIKEQFIEFHNYLLENYSIWIVAGLGNWSNNLMLTWKSFQRANEAVNYTSRKETFCNYHNIKRNTSQYYYPMDIAIRLTNFIKSGNKSQVVEIFKIINCENLEARDLPINMMNYLVADIRNTLLKIRFELEINDKNKEIIKRIDEKFTRPKSLGLCKDLAIDLCEVYDLKTSNNELITNIKDYIHKNYQDQSISLIKISTEFSISESYFSYLFKEETGENFSVYLESIRMEQALKLLRTTDIAISDLYEEVGYNNSNTFRRVFKKNYGLSPKAMRDQISNND